MHRYYDLVDNKPVPVISLSGLPTRTLDRTEIGPVLISTVFLGINHAFNDDGPPILFETMIFGGALDQYQQRYCTYEEAIQGHRLAVLLVDKHFYDSVKEEEPKHDKRVRRRICLRE